MKFVSVLVVTSLVFLGISPMFATALTYYWQPEIYENGTNLAYGSTIYRNFDVDSVINIMLRRISDSKSEGGVYIRLMVINNLNQTLYDNVEETFNYVTSQTDLYYAQFIINSGAFPVGNYTLEISSTTTYGYYESTYSMQVTVGSKLQIPVPKSVTFLKNSIEKNEEVDVVVRLNTDVEYVEFINEYYAVSLTNTEEQFWKSAVFFSDSGNLDFNINVMDIYNNVYEYSYNVYIAEKVESLYVPTVRVFDNGDETYTTIMKSITYISSSAYKEDATWHLIVESSNNIIVDMTTAEPVSVDRSFWFYDYKSDEVQVIVSGVLQGVGITYVFDDMGLEVKRLFGDIKIKGVNDWRNLWGLLGDSLIMSNEETMRAGGIFNVDYDDSFGFYTSERTLVVRY